MDKPKTIFKYEDYNTYTLQNLKSQIIYFGSPKNFNDPYDCAITAGLEMPTGEELEEIRVYYLAQPNLLVKTKIEFESLPAKELECIIIKAVAEQLKYFKQKFLVEFGASCFSEKNDNLLMWSHYGGHYKGICCEFYTEHEPFTLLRKVQYNDEMPKIKVTSIIHDEIGGKVVELFFTKAKAWEYEQEWRIFNTKSG
ncbi:MAG: DUF2971 domain-containing protein, partial [Bacteroidetes bacterium]|nr:DUF2971 domain-containing protein [Bacteroidota bacterium]